MRKQIVLIAAVGLTLMGCKQDPLADYPASVRNATPEQKTDTGNDTFRDSMFIDSNEFYHVKEGDTLTFEVKGRILIEKATFELSVDNLADFKGATFNPANGAFSWKVPQDAVTNDLQEILPLKVTMVADNNGTVLVQSKTVNIFVLRDLANPTVSLVNGLNQQLREGSVQNFEVVVKSTEEISKPVLSVVMNHVGIENGSGFVSLRTDVSNNPVQNSVDKTLWTFALQMNLSDADVTNGLSSLYFGLQAFSSFGMMSVVTPVSVKVITSWVEPKSSWNTQEVQFTQGQSNSYSFTVMDPRDEGRVETTFNNCTALGAVCGCTSVTRSVVNCTVTWNPKVSDVNRTHRVTFTTYNRSTISTDPTFTQKDYVGNIRVIAAPMPSPTPAPTPAPVVAAAVGGN